jgi:hypothetical protein
MGHHENLARIAEHCHRRHQPAPRGRREPQTAGFCKSLRIGSRL